MIILLLNKKGIISIPAWFLGRLFPVEKGRQYLPIILATITTSILIAILLYLLLNLPTMSAILIGVGSSICGGSAIAATAFPCAR